MRAKDWSQRTVPLGDGVAESGGIGVGRKAENIQVGQQGGVFIVGLAEVLDLADGAVGVCPLRVVRGRIGQALIGGARNITIDGYIKGMERITRVEDNGYVQGNKLQLQGG